jgi:glucose-6-phosphate isomerase
VYAIAMDVGKHEHREALAQRMLLFGVVTYARGSLGQEPIRSQGHIHSVSPSCGCSTPEVYEIWRGQAVIYLQEHSGDNPGSCYAVHGSPGDVILVPPGWVHATVSADPAEPLTFGAWCVRDYGFEYGAVRAHGGIAWFPLLGEDGVMRWQRNPAYGPSELTHIAPERYAALGLKPGEPIYRQFERDTDRFRFVSNPRIASEVWEGFMP